MILHGVVAGISSAGALMQLWETGWRIQVVLPVLVGLAVTNAIVAVCGSILIAGRR